MTPVPRESGLVRGGVQAQVQAMVNEQEAVNDLDPECMECFWKGDMYVR